MKSCEQRASQHDAVHAHPFTLFASDGRTSAVCVSCGSCGAELDPNLHITHTPWKPGSVGDLEETATIDGGPQGETTLDETATFVGGPQGNNS